MKKRAVLCKRGLSFLLAVMMLGSLLPAGIITAQGTTGIDVYQAPLQTVYDEPATDWQSQTLPLGNGFIGASVFGGIDGEEILINEHTLWSGGPGASADYDGGLSDTDPQTNKDNLKKVRELLAEVMTDFSANYEPGIGAANTQNYPSLSSELNDLINSLKGEKTDFGSYQELGSIHIDEVSGNPLLEAYAVNCVTTDISGLLDGVKSGSSNANKWFSASNGGTWNDTTSTVYPFDLVLHYLEPKTIGAYSFTTANDNVKHNRSPKSWDFYGSSDGKNWTLLHSVTDANFTGNWQTKSFVLDKSASYAWYKWTIKENDGGWGTQLGEIELLDAALAMAYGQNCYNTQFTNSSKASRSLSNLFDGDQATKWFSADGESGGTAFETPDDLVLQYSAEVTVSGYRMKLANDSVTRGRIPKSWTLYGSDDGQIWEEVQKVDDGGFALTTDTYEEKVFILNQPASYKWFKFSFTAITGNGTYTGNGVQLAELSMNLISAPEDKNYPSITSYGNHETKEAESVEKLFDSNDTTKWYTLAGTSGTTQAFPVWAQLELETALTIGGYGIVSGNDADWRDPTAWQLMGSHDGTNWVPIDTQTDIEFSGRRQEKKFTLAETCSFRYLRFQVDAVKENKSSGGGLQMSELIFYDASGNQINIPTVGINEDTNYKRTLNLDNATATVSYNDEGIDYNREYFVSNPGNFMAARLTASKAGSLNKLIRFETPQTKAVITAEDDTITITGSPEDQIEEEHLKFAAQIKVVTDGELITLAKSIQVVEASYIELYMTAGTNYQQDVTNDGVADYFNDTDPLDDVKARLLNLNGKSYDELKVAHVADYKALYDRVKLDLGSSEQPSKMTDDLLAGYKDGSNTAAENRYLEALYYQFGRYLLIASSREGSLPANLQGIWGEGLSMPWNADYHTNINIQMNYWLAQQTNLAECHQPMIDYINAQVEHGEVTANTYHYNTSDETQAVRGWTAYHENNIWGNTAPATSSAFYFSTGAAWMCQDIWEQYAFTLDKEALAASYDTLKGAALFWVDNLVVDPRDGTLVSSPARSPEHGPYSLGTSADQTIIWELFNNTLKAAEVMGDTSSEIEEIRTAQSKLSLPKVGVNGQYMEWKDEVTIDVTGDNGHRHVNHLYALHPGTLVVAGRSAEDDEFVEAMRLTLETRGDGGTGWSKAWKINFWARLRDGDHAGTMVQQILKQSTYDNLYDAHPPFQIDGNFGSTAGMTEMFLQSQGDSIDLLPALPAMWNGSVISGLRARGNVEVDIVADENGKVKSAVLKPESSHEELKVRSEGLGSYLIKDSKGHYVTANRVDENTLTFAVTAGETYTLVPGTPVTGITVNMAEATLADGDTLQLIAAVTPVNATDTSVYWTSSDEDVATVADGLVTAVGKGEATITVTTTEGGKSAQCVVTVTGHEVVNPFIDVKEADYFYAPALWAADCGITKGDNAENTFNPEGDCIRAQVVTFLWRAAGEPNLTEGMKNPFTDVKEGDYYYNAVLWAVANGITAGTSDTTFSPEDPCTRAQVATFLYRYDGENTVDAENPFTDLIETEYYVPAVLWAVEMGITKGDGGGTTFNPDGTCTRAQIVTFLYRYMCE